MIVIVMIGWKDERSEVKSVRRPGFLYSMKGACPTLLIFNRQYSDVEAA